MWFILIRILFAGLIFLIAVLLNRHRRWEPKKYYLLVVALVIVSQILLSFVTPDMALLRFPSAEKAYAYNHSAKIDSVIEGREACLVIGDKNGSYNNAILTCDERGWISSNAGLPEKLVHTKDALIELYCDRHSGDCFLILVDTTGASAWSLSVRCDQETQFVHWQDSHVAAAYIGTLESPCQLEINDTTLTFARDEGMIVVETAGE